MKNRLFKSLATAVLTIAALAAGRSASAESVTYNISGATEANYPNPGDVTCHLTVTASGDATGSASTSWNYNNATSVSLQLPGGITLAFGTDKTSRGMAVQGVLQIEGATETGGWLTLSHASKYVYHIVLKDSYGTVLCNALNGAETFNCIFPQASIRSIEVQYADDIPLNDETTTLLGIEEYYKKTGSPIKPEPTVVWLGLTLTKDEDYRIDYGGDTVSGQAYLTVHGIEPFSGSVTKGYSIVQPPIFPTVWESGRSYSVTEDESIVEAVTVTGNVTLSIAEGKTLAVHNIIAIASGATLTVVGPGTLTVINSTTAAMGAHGTSSNVHGGPGETGAAGIDGNVIVNGATVNVRGGNGGNGGNGYYEYASQAVVPFRIGYKNSSPFNNFNNYLPRQRTGFYSKSSSVPGFGGVGIVGIGGVGGTGGMGITGTLTVNSGTVSVRGGQGGSGGEGFVNGSYGELGQAVGGTVTCTANGYVIQESDNNTFWTVLASGSQSTKEYLRVLLQESETLTARQAYFAGQTRYWATFYHPDWNYRLPAGAQAFILKSDHVLYRLGDGSVIPAGCAVVIMAESASIELTPTNTAAPSVEGNILQGTTEAITAPANAHVLGQVSESFGFFEFTGTIPANKAYYVE